MLVRLEFTNDEHRYRAALVDNRWILSVDGQPPVEAFRADEAVAYDEEDLKARLIGAMQRRP